MKPALFAVLAALVSVPAYAAPLNSADWKTEAPTGCFVFNNDGSLTVTGNSNGKELHYILGEEAAGTLPMQNGSGLSVSLQFNTEAFLKDVETCIHIAFRNDNPETGGEDVFQKISIQNVTGQLNIYDSNNIFDKFYSLDSGKNITTEIEMDFIIENNLLCGTYSINGVKSELFTLKEVSPDLDWKPSFGLSNTETNVFTVTDVTFTTIPEPASAALFLSLPAFFAVAVRRRRRK